VLQNRWPDARRGTLDQVGSQCRQSIVLTFRPTIFDLDAATLVNAGLNQAQPERQLSVAMTPVALRAKTLLPGALAEPSLRLAKSPRRKKGDELASAHTGPPR
jgi:hypothetical protein